MVSVAQGEVCQRLCRSVYGGAAEESDCWLIGVSESSQGNKEKNVSEVLSWAVVKKVMTGCK